MPQVVYETNLDLKLTEEKIAASSKSIGGPEYSKKGILSFYVDDDNIKEIQITPTGKVMIFCKNIEDLNKKIPMIKSLIISQDGSEATWHQSKIVETPATRLSKMQSILEKMSPRWIITAYNYVIRGGLRAELEVPALESPSRRSGELSDEEKKLLQLLGNLELSEKLRTGAEKELMRIKKDKQRKDD